MESLIEMFDQVSEIEAKLNEERDNHAAADKILSNAHRLASELRSELGKITGQLV